MTTFLKKRVGGLALIAALAVASCGGGGEDATTPTQVASDAGCKAKPYQSDELYVREAATCTLAGQPVTIYTFNDADGEKNWVEAASGFGGLYLVGDGWVISGPRVALESAQKGAGGTIQ